MIEKEEVETEMEKEKEKEVETEQEVVEKEKEKEKEKEVEMEEDRVKETEKHDDEAPSDTTKTQQHARPGKPGKKRLFVVLSVLVSFIAGIPFWLKSTEIYRSPLPYASIEEHTQRVMGSSLVFPCFFQFIFIEQDSIHNEELILKGLNEVIEKLYKSMHYLVTEHNSSYGGCTTSFGVTASLHQGRRCWRVGDPEGVPVWPCGLGNLELYDDANSNNALDDYLNSYSYEAQTHSKDHLSTNVRTGIYTILSINKLVHGVTDGYNAHQPFKAVIGKYRHAWILGNRQENMVGEEEISLMSDIAVRFFMNGGSFQYQNKVTVEEKGSSIPLAADGRAILSFSLLNAQPKDWIFDWDFNELEEHFLAPVVEALRPIAELNVESQVLYYTPSQVQSFWDPKLRKHVVLSKDIPFFVNANEWHLDTSSAAAGRSKLLHFAIYVPPAGECPLHLKHKDGSLSKTNGFISPGWGGVTIFNPPRRIRKSVEPIRHLSIEDLKLVMLVVIAQIRELFGLPPLVLLGEDKHVALVPAVSSGFADWELDLLVRRRATADVKSSASTLRSLSHLVQSLPNMVIMEEIGDQVRRSLMVAEAAEKNASSGLYFIAADAARKARALAEEAFFQPSIMSHLYLPLEHHFAIYAPFFVPVLLHTVLAAVTEGRRYMKGRKAFLSGTRKV